MIDDADSAANIASNGDESGGDVLWPLSYSLSKSEQPVAERWWSYQLYRNPDDEKVQVLYSNNKARSEELAQKFLDEPVVGFDMEWPVIYGQQTTSLQRRIGLIQVASEDKIALFHIGLHPGKTSEEIIAPSLRKLIESPSIAKTGVGILGADFARLRRFFGLNPQGAFELSHLDRLVKFAYIPHLLDTKMVSLANLVEGHLGLPLDKGPVRTSNWSRPLSDEQKNYAASDAYAGFMLFHCMNAKRLALKPVPGLPIFAEQYPSKSKGTKGFAPIRTLMLHPTEAGGSIVAASEFFKTQKDETNAGEEAQEEKDVSTTSIEGDEEENIEKQTKKKTKKKTEGKPAKTTSKATQEPLDPTAQALFDRLAERRKALASANGVPAYLIANNSVLRGLAQNSPRDEEGLLKVRGVGKVSAAKYGADWLEVIARHLAAQGDEQPAAGLSTGDDKSGGKVPKTPAQASTPRSKGTQISPDSSPAFETPIARTPILHTGLSFTLAESRLDAGDRFDGRAPSYPVLRMPTSRQQEEDVEIIDMTGNEIRYPDLSKGDGPAETDDESLEAPRGAAATCAESTACGRDQSPESSEDSLVFVTPPSRSSSVLKRKRTEARSHSKSPSRAQARSTPPNVCVQAESRAELVSTTPSQPLSPRSKIFRNKLVAFSRLVRWKTGADPTEAIVSEATLDMIVRISPRTMGELRGIAGIEGFARACKDAEVDLLRNIIKFAPD